MDQGIRVAEELTLLLSSVVRESFRDSPTPDGVDPIKIVVTRDEERWVIDPSKFDMFTFRDGDELAVIPPEEAAKLPTTWGDVIVPIEAGNSIRVPPRQEFCRFKGSSALFGTHAGNGRSRLREGG